MVTNINIQENGHVFNILKDMKKCEVCGGKLKSSFRYMIKGNRSTEIKVKECEKCGESFLDANEYEKARKILNPSLLIRLRYTFKNLMNSEHLSIFGRKIL